MERRQAARTRQKIYLARTTGLSSAISHRQCYLAIVSVQWSNHRLKWTGHVVSCHSQVLLSLIPILRQLCRERHEYELQISSVWTECSLLYHPCSMFRQHLPPLDNPPPAPCTTALAAPYGGCCGAVGAVELMMLIQLSRSTTDGLNIHNITQTPAGELQVDPRWCFVEIKLVRTRHKSNIPLKIQSSSLPLSQFVKSHINWESELTN